MKKIAALLCALFSLGGGVGYAAHVAEAANAYVRVWTDTPGVESIVLPTPGRMDFHVTTTNVNAETFVAEIHVAAVDTAMLLSAEEVRLRVGEAAQWRVKLSDDDEPEPFGDIVVFKLDVRLGVPPDQYDEFWGAYLLRYTGAMPQGSLLPDNAFMGVRVPLKFECWPKVRPDSEEVNVEHTDGLALFEYVPGGDLKKAEESYKWSDIENRTFYAVGMKLSQSPGSDGVNGLHSLNGTHDEAPATVRNDDYGFVVRTKDRLFGDTPLVDSRGSDIRIFVPRGESYRDHTFNLSVHTAEKSGVKNKMGTEVECSQTAHPLLWETSQVYWYGRNDVDWGCCFTNRFKYNFVLDVDNGRKSITNSYSVEWPISDPYAEFFDPESQECFTKTTVSNPDLTYTCTIEFRAPTLRAEMFGIDIIDQYHEETIREESFHCRQFMALVGLDEGGSVDLYTTNGLVYHSRQLHGTETISVTSTSKDEAEEESENMANEVFEKEKEVCKNLLFNSSRRGFIEVKAKEHAGYNMAYLYHCTYETKYGANPTNCIHPAYQQQRSGNE